ncbi:Thymidylate kinase isoform X1 [Aix galericulata]|nr:Thymidylate kinase isoform X1 [Aix galericulata]
MKEKLRQGVTLVVDRYAFSGVAFTSAKENFCVDWCKQPDIGLPKPDLILFLQLSPEEAAARGDFGSERYENSLFQEKVLKSFYHLMKDKTLNWKMIDASKSIEDLHREIKSIAEETMLEADSSPEAWLLHTFLDSLPVELALIPAPPHLPFDRTQCTLRSEAAQNARMDGQEAGMAASTYENR